MCYDVNLQNFIQKTLLAFQLQTTSQDTLDLLSLSHRNNALTNSQEYFALHVPSPNTNKDHGFFFLFFLKFKFNYFYIEKFGKNFQKNRKFSRFYIRKFTNSKNFSNFFLKMTKFVEIQPLLWPFFSIGSTSQGRL